MFHARKDIVLFQMRNCSMFTHVYVIFPYVYIFCFTCVIGKDFDKTMFYSK